MIGASCPFADRGYPISGTGLNSGKIAAAKWTDGLRRKYSLFHCILLLVLLGISAEPDAQAYSLLTHEQLIDLTWQDRSLLCCEAPIKHYRG